MQYFLEWWLPWVKIQVLEFMSEIKFDLTLKKNKVSISFMLLFTIIKASTYSSNLTSGNELFSLAISRQFGLVQRV